MKRFNGALYQGEAYEPPDQGGRLIVTAPDGPRLRRGVHRVAGRHSGSYPDYPLGAGAILAEIGQASLAERVPGQD